MRDRGKHTIWSNGKETEAVPRHKEIAEGTANKILKTAGGYPGPKKK